MYSIAIKYFDVYLWWAEWFQWLTQSYHQDDEEILRESRIIELCKKNPDYFAPIYEKYYDQIFAYIFKKIGDDEDTADVTSRVFLKCLSNIQKYKFQGLPFTSWLYKIAFNEINQFFRKKQKNYRMVPIQNEDLGSFFEEIDFDQSSQQPEQLLERLFEYLTDVELSMLEMRFFEKRSFREIGIQLDITEVNAKVKTYRILDKLRKYLPRCLKNEEL